jgi:hypothetical protein
MERFVYVGIKACGCCVAGRVDTPDNPKDVAEFVAEMICDGLRVERVSVDDARCTLRRCRCDEPKSNQLVLFEARP